MKKTMTSNNIPEKSTLNDIEREDHCFTDYSVKRDDAFIAGTCGVAEDTGVIKVRLVDYTQGEKDGVKYFCLKWERLDNSRKLYSRVYLDQRIFNWNENCDLRTYNAAWKLCKSQGRTAPDIYDRLEALKGCSEVLVNYDYYKGSVKPILMLWLPSDSKQSYAYNYIPA